MNVSSIDHLGESGVAAFGENLVCAEECPHRFECRAPYVRYLDQGMRVAHRNRAELQRPPWGVQPVAVFPGVQADRNTGRIKSRDAHIDLEFAVRTALDADHARGALENHRLTVGFAIHRQIQRYAACPVSALTGRAAICIQDFISKYGALPTWGSKEQNLIATDTEVAIGEKTRCGSIQMKLTITEIQQYEIIAGSMHFVKAETIQR